MKTNKTKKIIKNLSGKITEYKIIKNNSVESPKVSVILPVYNVEQYLKECTESIINQTLKDIEIIFINDNSPDKSFEILKEYAKNDNRITLLTQKNYGAGVARNAGLDVARGEYLYIMDSDDVLVPNALERLYSEAKASNLEMIMFNCYLYDNKTKEKEIRPWSLKKEFIPNKKIFSYKEFAENIFNTSPSWAWNKFFKKDFIDRNNLIFQDTSHTNDAYFACMALVLAERMSIINEPLILYRTNQTNSLTSMETRNKKPLDIITATITIQNKLKEINRFEIVKNSFYRFSIELMHYMDTKTTGLANKLLLYNLKYRYFKKLEYDKIPEDILYPYAIEALKKIKKVSILQEIFSIKNQKGRSGKHKVITLFGLKLKIKKGKGNENI